MNYQANAEAHRQIGKAKQKFPELMARLDAKAREMAKSFLNKFMPHQTSLAPSGYVGHTQRTPYTVGALGYWLPAYFVYPIGVAVVELLSMGITG